MARINVYVSSHNEGRVRDMVERLGVPISHLFEGVALCMSDDEARVLLERREKMRRMERILDAKLDERVLAPLRGMSPSQIDEVLKTIAAVQASA